jgi:hypothetical protein
MIFGGFSSVSEFTTAHQTAFKTAIADSVPDVTVDQVAIISIGRRLSHEQELPWTEYVSGQKSAFGRRLQAEDGLPISYL